MPRHVVVSRDGLAPGESPPGFVEGEDFVEVRVRVCCWCVCVLAEPHVDCWGYRASLEGGGLRLGARWAHVVHAWKTYSYDAGVGGRQTAWRHLCLRDRTHTLDTAVGGIRAAGVVVVYSEFTCWFGRVVLGQRWRHTTV